MLQNRTYQGTFANNIAAALKIHRKIVAQLATGGGKTVIFSNISDRYVKKQNKAVLILCHRKEILQQTRRALHNFYGITCETIVAGKKYIPEAEVYVGMIESVNNRIPKIKNVGLVIIDECHIASFHKIHQHFPEQYIVGFTATPLTANKKKPLKGFYDEIVCGPTITELIKLGFLCQNITYAPKDIVDRKELSIKNGEFDDMIMAEKFSKPKFIKNTIHAYEQWGKEKKTIIFNVNIQHSKDVCEAFVSAGYDCRHLDSEMSATEREDVLLWFKNNAHAILCNVGIATTGFDEPTIEFVVINKATMSMPLWLQMTGRGSRPILADFIEKHQKDYPYKLTLKDYFIICDMGGNAITHGDWNQDRDWKSLFHDPKKPIENGVAPVKSCPECEAIVPASARLCPFCGYEFPAKVLGLEELVEEFVLVTKGIDVEKLIEENSYKKEYQTFFDIGEVLGRHTFKTVPKLSDEVFTFVLGKYHELAKKWAKQTSVKRQANNRPKVIYNKWHQDLAKETLTKELKKHFPTWQPATEII